jgi:hypothetical protein
VEQLQDFSLQEGPQALHERLAQLIAMGHFVAARTNLRGSPQPGQYGQLPPGVVTLAMA